MEIINLLRTMLKGIPFLVLLLIPASSPHLMDSAGSSCKGEWQRNTENDRCYYISDDLASRRMAMRKCEAMESHLISVDTLVEHNFLISQLNEKRRNCRPNENCNEFWIGLRYWDKNWVWMDGTAPSQSRWSSGFPTHRGGNCVLMGLDDESKKSAAWKNEKCDKLRRFVCEAYCRSGFAYSYKANKCYGLVPITKSWDDAWKTCPNISANAQLAIILSEAENEAVIDYFKAEFKRTGSPDCSDPQFKQNFWVAARRVPPETCQSDFSWRSSLTHAQQYPMNYTKWKNGEPNCRGGVEACVHISQAFDYKWNDEECKSQRCFVCEMKH